jgi:hypothetical protein
LPGLNWRPRATITNKPRIVVMRGKGNQCPPSAPNAKPVRAAIAPAYARPVTSTKSARDARARNGAMSIAAAAANGRRAQSNAGMVYVPLVTTTNDALASCARVT